MYVSLWDFNKVIYKVALLPPFTVILIKGDNPKTYARVIGPQFEISMLNCLTAREVSTRFFR